MVGSKTISEIMVSAFRRSVLIDMKVGFFVAVFQFFSSTLSVLRYHSFSSFPPQRPITYDFVGFSS